MTDWQCERPGQWRKGSSGWWVKYGTRVSGEPSQRGWWLRYWEKLAPVNPFPTLSAAQEWAHSHHGNFRPVITTAEGKGVVSTH